MNYNELQIDDKVYITLSDDTKVIATVGKMFKTWAVLKYNGRWYWRKYSAIEPIELTEKFFNVNMFRQHKPETDNCVLWLTDDFFDVSAFEYSDSIWVITYNDTEFDGPINQMTICHVHQCQHFFRDCGLAVIANNLTV